MEHKQNQEEMVRLFLVSGPSVQIQLRRQMEAHKKEVLKELKRLWREMKPKNVIEYVGIVERYEEAGI